MDANPSLIQRAGNPDARANALCYKETTMNKKLKSILFAIALIATSAWAEEKSADVIDMQALRKAVQTDRKALVASALALTDTEAKRFWPLYDAYQRDVDMSNRKRVVALTTLVAQDKPLSDLYAKN